MSAESLPSESTGGHRRPLQKIVLGTRGSELARAQTQLVEKALRSAGPNLEIATEIVVTRGDQKTEPIDPKAGRKGLFTSEIERSLLEGRIDVAVHSAKDLPSEPTAGLEICAVLPRAPVNDVLIAKNAENLETVPQGATVATGSVRRQHQLRWKRPDLRVVELRGNVPTRLHKLAANDWDAIILARAGLERLGYDLTRRHVEVDGARFYLKILPREEFFPAGGQGVIALQMRADDTRARDLVEMVNHPETMSCLRAERHFLRLLHGDCDQPVGVLATIEGGLLKIQAQVFDSGRIPPRVASVQGESQDAEAIAAELLAQIERG